MYTQLRCAEFKRRIVGHTSRDWRIYIYIQPQVDDPLYTKWKNNIDSYFILESVSFDVPRSITRLCPWANNQIKFVKNLEINKLMPSTLHNNWYYCPPNLRFLRAIYFSYCPRSRALTLTCIRPSMHIKFTLSDPCLTKVHY